jgi:hypothetical protein
MNKIFWEELIGYFPDWLTDWLLLALASTVIVDSESHEADWRIIRYDCFSSLETNPAPAHFPFSTY